MVRTLVIVHKQCTNVIPIIKVSKSDLFKVLKPFHTQIFTIPIKMLSTVEIISLKKSSINKLRDE